MSDGNLLGSLKAPAIGQINFYVDDSGRCNRAKRYNVLLLLRYRLAILQPWNDAKEIRARRGVRGIDSGIDAWTFLKPTQRGRTSFCHFSFHYVVKTTLNALFYYA